MPLSQSASRALEERPQTLKGNDVQLHATLHLSSDDLPERSIIVCWIIAGGCTAEMR